MKTPIAEPVIVLSVAVSRETGKAIRLDIRETKPGIIETYGKKEQEAEAAGQ